MKISTKNLVILGFALILLIFGGLAFFGYTTNKESAEGFGHYQAFLEQTNMVNDSVDEFSDATTQMVLFRQNPGNFNESADDSANGAKTPDFFAASRAHLDKSEKDLASVAALLDDDPANIRPQLEKVQNNLKKYRDISSSIHGDMKNLRADLNQKLIATTELIVEGYEDLDEFAVRIDNSRISSRGGQIYARFLQLRNSINRSVDRLDPSQSEEISKTVNTIIGEFASLHANATTDIGRNYIGVIVENMQTFKATTDAILEAVAMLDGNFKATADLDNLISGDLQNLLRMVDGEMDKVATGVEELNENSTKLMVLFGAIGVAIGAVIAIFIILRLVSTLTRMADYAKEVAAGNFTTTLNINEPGEMGEVASSLRSIPEVLTHIVKEFSQLASNVSHGQLDTQGHPDNYNGSFRSIMEGTNDIMTNFRGVIDEIPSIVVTLDESKRVAYMNSAGQEVAGANYKGRLCKELFDRSDDATENCALTKAYTTKKRHSAETKAHPQGQELDITYTSIPVLDEKGDVSAVMQFITDLTQIKETQNIIVRTVRQATEIADRVAAASEELAAQMQQVNNGAEMQRDRVSSTATAMEEMNATVLDVARNAGQASEQTDAARVKAHNGANIVSDVVNSINRLNEITGGLHTDMSELGNKAEEVGSVMGVIADIADQTNLLALNAAIEAARAGEAGRGFAVVADEVRKLAENTMSATSEVGAVIQAIQQATSKNINNVNTAAENMVTATEQAHSAGEALNEIVDLVNESALLISGIATASEQQSATSEEINQSVDEINRIVGETSESVVQSSAAVDDLARTAVELKEVLNNLRD